MLELEKIKKLEDKTELFLRNYNRSNAIALYGAGNSGHHVIKYLRSKGISPVAVIDSNPEKWGKSYCDCRVLSLKQALDSYANLNVFISASTFEREIRDALKKIIPEDRIHFFEYERLFYCEIPEYRNFVSDHIQDLLFVYENLSDQCSQQTMEEIVNLWCSADPKHLEKIYAPDQYFPNDIIQLTEHESFVDCGAFTGDTFEQFYAQVGGKYDHYYGLEPQKECYAELKLACGTDERNCIFTCGASDRKEQLRFSNDFDKGHATVTNGGETMIDVCPIDELISDKGKVTFIKMDIEGSELKALRGAEKTIINHKPKLAICVYHRMTDMVEIPKYIMGLGLNYRYYIRHHQRFAGVETVFYAV